MTDDTRRALLDALADGPVRGPAFAEAHGLTRAAVWKQVEALREAGFVVESTPAGYRVTGVPEFGAAAVLYGLSAPYDAEFHASIPSTNSRARDLAAEGAADVVVLADEQTGGRGRRGRGWTGPSGGVYASLLVRPDRPPAHAPVFTLATAVAVVRACDPLGVDARIKWPNDVLVDTGGEARKLAGILSEMEGEAGRVAWLVAGVGVNANVDADALPAGATSLRAVRGDVDRAAFVRRLLEAFHELAADLEGVLPAWRERADTLGRRVRVETPGRTVVGRARDVEFPGALVVATDTGVERVHAGDCEHLRPEPADR
ncbi:MAG: birA, biotin-[acetyl-CoA-carboxylase] ligase region [uncultured archaeon A07HB70]|nr:MAG: birA, biotin-[acetyl-CoA-carboxylase] ligase region [uncultured archaeon A07HB70]